MDALSRGICAIDNIRIALSNPALGDSDERLKQTFDLLGELGTLLAGGGDAIEDMKAFAAQVEAMAVAEPEQVEEEVLEEKAPTTEPTAEVEENTTAGESDREEERLDSAEGEPE